MDLVLVTGFFAHMDLQWEEPSFERHLRRLASFSRLIMFDPRGTGLSDRATELPTLEEQMDDVNAVLEAVGSERATIYGVSQGGAMAALYAATYPRQTRALVLYAGNPSVRGDEDYPLRALGGMAGGLGGGRAAAMGEGAFLDRFAPSRAGDAAFRRWWGRFERCAASPGNAMAWIRMHVQIDIVGSTDLAAELGDRPWRGLLERFRAAVHAELGRLRGREIDTAGGCSGLRGRGPRARPGDPRGPAYTGEVELLGDDLAGIAVHIAARVIDQSVPSEVLASRTVTDLVAGSGLSFEDRGERRLKGVPRVPAGCSPPPASGAGRRVDGPEEDGVSWRFARWPQGRGEGCLCERTPSRDNRRAGGDGLGATCYHRGSTRTTGRRLRRRLSHLRSPPGRVP